MPVNWVQIPDAAREVRIKQFFAIPLAVKVVVPGRVMAMHPVSFLMPAKAMKISPQSIARIDSPDFR